MTARPSICYAAPGHSLVSTAGSTRNILAAARALSEWVDVTVAFRDAAESTSGPYRIVTLDPSKRAETKGHDDVAARGLNPFSHLDYLKTLRRFAAQSEYDLVLEKGWRLSGFLAREFGGRGVRAALIENDARIWDEPLRGLRSLARLAAHTAAQTVAARCSRSLPLIIAETEELKTALIERRKISPARVHVVPLGVDHELFKPMSQNAARAVLGLPADVSIMLYVGGMDQYHDLSALLESLASIAPPAMELHLVGDGEYRARYERLAAGLSVPVRFHGQVEHRSVPVYIAAADVCLAPYKTSGFHDQQVYFSTLKIPEYMACARPVISVASGSIRRLIENEVTGFLFPNEAASWKRFLAALPARERLATMGRAAAPRVASLDWSATARRYLELSDAVLGSRLL